MCEMTTMKRVKMQDFQTFSHQIELLYRSVIIGSIVGM